jgi:hypothetical protein
LIEPSARAGLSPEAFDALQNSMAGAIHNVFWIGTALAALALLVTFYLPRNETGTIEPPNEDVCSAETGERLIIAELTTIDSEHEPSGKSY